MHLACSNNHLSVIACLLDHKADINKINEYNWTPVMTVAYWAGPEVVQLLVERGADLTKQHEAGETAIDMAIRYARGDNVHVLQSASKLQQACW